MPQIRFRQILWTVVKNPILRNILVITLGVSVFFPLYNSIIIFPEFSNQLTLYAQDSAIRLSRHFQHSIFKNSALDLEKHLFTPDVENELRDLMKNLGIEEIKVFSKSGEVIYSPDPEDIGEMNTHDYFKTQVAAGRVFTKVVRENSKTLEGRMVERDVVETYVPVLSDGVFKGAIEVYYDITETRGVLSGLINRLKMVMAVFHVSFLFVLCFVLIKAGRNLIERETAETLLQKNRENLEKMVVERTYELNRTNQSLLVEIENQRLSDLALKESEIRLKTILESNPDPIILYDLKGSPLYLNPAFTTLFGWALEELNGRSIPFVPEDQKEFTAKKIWEMYKYGKVQAFETKRLTKNHQTLEVLVSAALTRAADESPIGIVVHLTNISEKKALEAQYKHAQKLEAIGTLAGGIAHDFNNILSGIMGYSQLARMNISEPEKAVADIDQVIKAANRAKDLVRQILTFSRQSEYQKQPLKIFIIVKEALKLIRSSIPATIEIKEDIVSKASVMADPTQIHQVVMNLCTNAYHAMRETGGTLSVGLKEIAVPGPDAIVDLNMTPGNYLRLEVHDTGTGIEPSMMDKIFDPYFTTKSPEQGTGLGLAVVHGIVKDSGGYIKVYSQPGKGSCFIIFLPVSNEKENESEKTENDYLHARGTERIMIVDDEENIRDSMTEFFSDLGYRPIAYSNGQMALDAFLKSPDEFDFIISDCTMPSYTGFDLAASIFKERPGVPVILCSGYTEKVTDDMMNQDGIYKFLEKPVDLEKLAMLVREKLDQKLR